MIPRFWLLVIALAVAPSSFAQLSAPAIEAKSPAHPPNANSVYSALRAALPLGDGMTVSDWDLKREGAIFHFEQGNFFPYGPVNGVITGVVFEGKGHFTLIPKGASEQRSLALLAKNGVMEQDFTTLLLRFTDRTAEELKKATKGSAGAATSQAASAARDAAKGFREHLHDNLELRMLGDVLNHADDGSFFMASFRMGGLIGGKNVLFIVDPGGTPHAAPDTVELSTWDDQGPQVWAAYDMAHPSNGESLHISAEKIDTTIEHNGKMTAATETTLTVQRNGLRVVPLDLFPTLRVSGVFAADSSALDFVQESKDADPDFAVILPEAAKAGDRVRILTKYAGTGAVKQEGPTVYYLLSGARDSWYPSTGGMGDHIDFRMTFHIPKNLQVVATGKQVSQENTGGSQTVVWQTEQPIPVAGFNLGSFKTQQDKTKQGFDVTAYVNTDLPDYVAPLANGGAPGSAHEEGFNDISALNKGGPPVGSLSGVPMLKSQVAQGMAAVQIYSDYFGKLPYDHVALTEQSPCNYGQSWPMLVYLPICAFWDGTVQHELGLSDFGAGSYWKEVTPHEVSHQWWGQLVSFKSYRDQWMSEGFANFSTGLFLLETRPKMDEYRAFWSEQHQRLVQKNAMGVRPIDAGALTMGYRVNNTKTGDVYQDLIYSKGAFVLHMLEMMYWTPNNGEEPFKKAMHTFVAQYAGKAATTEDFQHSLEQNLPKWMDASGDGKLDWFFNEYVYGTELPHYTVTSECSAGADGVTSVHLKLAQSNVSKDFVMIVPIYLQLENGSTVRMANVLLRGDQNIDQTVKIGKMPSPAKKVLVNYNADVLSD